MGLGLGYSHLSAPACFQMDITRGAGTRDRARETENTIGNGFRPGFRYNNNKLLIWQLNFTVLYRLLNEVRLMETTSLHCAQCVASGVTN